MENILSWLSSKVVPPAVIILFLGSTVATSSLAGMKLFSPAGPSVQGISTVEQVSSLGTVNSGSSSNVAKPTATKTPTITSVPKSPGSLALNTNTNATANTVTGCIITLFGKQYDVTSLRTTHSGGDVFKCGTDMSTTYQSQHGTNVSRMQAYLVASSSTGSTTGSSTGTSGTSGTSGATGTGGSSTGSIGSTGASGDNEDEPESEDERERYIEENKREEEKQRLESEREQAKQEAESKAEEAR